MLFLLELFLLFIKLFAAILIHIFLWDNILLKAVFLILCYILLYFLIKYISNPMIYNYPNNYKLTSICNHFYNILVLTLYTGLFTFGVFWLRLSNMERTINLNSYFTNLIVLINNASYPMIILNLFLFCFFLCLYMIFIMFLGHYYRYHIIKRHLYLSNVNVIEASFYEHFANFIKKFSLYEIFRLIIKLVIICYRCCNIKELYTRIINTKRIPLLKEYFSEYKNHNFIEIFFMRTFEDIKYYIHHFICLIILLYDIMYNNMVITHVFQILPYVFLYEIWVRVSKFYAYLHSIRDGILYSLLYDPATIDKELGIIYTSSGELTLEDFQDITFNYLFPGLICKDQKELYRPAYLKKLKNDLLKKCSQRFQAMFKSLYSIHEKFIGLTKIDYIILAEIIFLLIILRETTV
jgi:hypothetical protein